jgi:hypothetical protein
VATNTEAAHGPVGCVRGESTHNAGAAGKGAGTVITLLRRLHIRVPVTALHGTYTVARATHYHCILPEDAEPFSAALAQPRNGMSPHCA